jgi:hypothetical protein
MVDLHWFIFRLRTVQWALLLSQIGEWVLWTA